MKGRVVFLGGGAVGAFAGGRMAEAGVDVTLVDGWPEHVEAIRTRGLAIRSPEDETVSRPRALHLGEASRIRELAPEAAFLTVKLYDTRWAATLLAQWLAPGVPVVTLQNALVEETVAEAVGRERVLGAIGGGLDVRIDAPGTVLRTRRRGSTPGPVFKVGELDGQRTPRAERIADLLALADKAAVTTDLWTERWEKLCANAMTTGVSGLSGYGLKAIYSREDTRRIAVALGAQALAVGRARGLQVRALFGVPAERWMAAASGDASAHAQAMEALLAVSANMVEGGLSGTLQDLQKQRPTEVDYLNGYVAAEGERLGVPAPAHRAVAELVRAVERGERAIGPALLVEIGA